MTRALSLLLLTTSLAGCAEIMPTVDFDTLDVTDISFQDIDVDFVFWVNNPNPIDIALDSLSYNLGFEAINVVSGADALQMNENLLLFGSTKTVKVSAPHGGEVQQLVPNQAGLLATASRAPNTKGNLIISLAEGPVSVRIFSATEKKSE